MYRLFPQYKLKMEYNYQESLKPSFNSRINEELVTASRYIRLHVSGDFYSQEYLDKWIKIAEANEHYLFYTYTKRIDLDYRKLPKNLVIYLSDDYMNMPKRICKRFNGVTSIIFKYSNMNRFKDYFICPGNCGTCLKCTVPGNKIAFKLH